MIQIQFELYIVRNLSKHVSHVGHNMWMWWKSDRVYFLILFCLIAAAVKQNPSDYDFMRNIHKQGMNASWVTYFIPFRTQFWSCHKR